MARPGATHRAAARSYTPATRDRTGRLHRDVHGRPVACRNPGLLDDPGLASASRPRIARARRHPAGSPAIPEPGPRARRHPGVPAGLPFTPCAVTLDQLHRQGDGPRAAGTTDGDSSARRQSRKTLSAACAIDSANRRNASDERSAFGRHRMAHCPIIEYLTNRCRVLSGL
jgi:hypothetical protein